jgi:hypothetical protein
MTQNIRCVGMAIVVALCLALVSSGDDAESAPIEAAATDATTTTSPQTADDVGTEGSAAREAATQEGDAAADEPAAGTDQTPDENEPPDADDEPSAEDQAFLQDPFSYLQSDMQSATMDLKEGQTTPPADVTQPRILHRLGLLIEQLERQGSGAGQAGQRVNRPAEQSSLMRGPGGQNEMRAPRDDGRDWADLSPKERQKILQSKTDGFPAGYDDILADYFRRVARAQQEDVGSSAAEEQPSDTPAAPAGETTN